MFFVFVLFVAMLLSATIGIRVAFVVGITTGIKIVGTPIVIEIRFGLVGVGTNTDGKAGTGVSTLDVCRDLGGG